MASSPPPAIRDYREQSVRHDERPLPDHHCTDRTYPTCWWRAEDGLDEAAVSEFLRVADQ